MKKFCATLFTLILLAGCAAAEVTISKTDYEQALGKAVCEVVTELNARGELADKAALERDFDPLLQQAVAQLGYSADDWLAAKAQYFPDEAEHTKLVEMHFTWCLVGDSIPE
ncbi:MAG: hypothetical protein WCV72_00345 [Patescibacteria group bacterium]